MTDKLRRTDSGMTLVEMLIAMVLIGAVSSLVVGAMTQVSRTFMHSNDEQQGLADAKTVLDRVARDVREARGIVCDGGLADPTDSTSLDPNCAAHLQVWIDDDSDYAEDPEEIVTWRLQAAEDGDHFDVWRTTGAGGQQKAADSLIVQTLFEYDTANPEEASLVEITMQYDALVGVGVDLRQAVTAARLRNG